MFVRLSVCHIHKLFLKNLYREKNMFYSQGMIEESVFRNGISKVDLQNRKIVAKWWDKDENLFPGEPIFIGPPNPGLDEDDGVILTAVTDKRKNHKDFLLILDAKTLEEIARAEFSSHVPMALHGIFVPS